MKITVITVCLNSRATIIDTVRSVLSQSHANLEYLIIDGGSTDGTLEALEPYRNQIRQIISEADSGIYDAMNKGLALATGEVIALLNADDCYADTAVLADVAAMLTDPSLDACYGDLICVDSADPGRIRRYWRAGAMTPARLRNGWVPPHPSFFLRAELYQRHGGFLTNFRIAGDYELLVRMINRHQIRCGYLPRVLVRMRTGGASTRNPRAVLRSNREAWHAWRINGVPITPWRFLYKPLSKLGQYLVRPKGNHP